MIYKGTLKTLYVKDFQVSDEGLVVALDLDSVVVAKDSLFYRNFTGRLINFEHATFLPSFQEAEAFVKGVCECNPDSSKASCLYADYSSIEKCPEETRSVREIKKYYKAKKKN